MADVLDGLGRILLDAHHLLGDRVARHPAGVLQGPVGQERVALGVLDDLALHVLVDGGFLCGHEAGAHIGPVGAKGERGGQRAAIGHAARGDHRNLYRVDRRRQQDHDADIVLARMSGALEAVDRDHVHAQPLGGNRVTDRGAFVDHLDPIGLEARQMIDRAAARRLDDLDAALDDRFAVIVVRNGVERRQERQVHPERLVGQIATALDLVVQRFLGLRHVRDDEGERTGVGRRRHQRGRAQAGHTAHNNRRLDAEHLREFGPDHFVPGSFPPAVGKGAATVPTSRTALTWARKPA